MICTHLRNLWNLFPVLTRDGDVEHTCAPEPSPEIKAETAIRDDFASRKARAYKKASSNPRQKFVHFGPVTEIDQQTWKRLSIGRAGPREDPEEGVCHSKTHTCSVSAASAATSNLKEDHMLNPQNDCRYFHHYMCKEVCMGITAAFKEFADILKKPPEMTKF